MPTSIDLPLSVRPRTPNPFATPPVSRQNSISVDLQGVAQHGTPNTFDAPPTTSPNSIKSHDNTSQSIDISDAASLHNSIGLPDTISLLDSLTVSDLHTLQGRPSWWRRIAGKGAIRQRRGKLQALRQRLCNKKQNDKSASARQSSTEKQFVGTKGNESASDTLSTVGGTKQAEAMSIFHRQQQYGRTLSQSETFSRILVDTIHAMVEFRLLNDFVHVHGLKVSFRQRRDLKFKMDITPSYRTEYWQAKARKLLQEEEKLEQHDRVAWTEEKEPVTPYLDAIGEAAKEIGMAKADMVREVKGFARKSSERRLELKNIKKQHSWYKLAKQIVHDKRALDLKIFPTNPILRERIWDCLDKLERKWFVTCIPNGDDVIASPRPWVIEKRRRQQNRKAGTVRKVHV